MTATLTPNHEPTNRPQAADGWDRPFLHGLFLVCAVLLVQARGIDGWLRTGAECLPELPAAVETDTGNPDVSVSRAVALSHALRQLTGTDRDRPAVRLRRN
jgi:hypothetical protein